MAGLQNLAQDGSCGIEDEGGILSADTPLPSFVIYNIVLLHELRRVVDALQEEGIPAIVLKGPVLGQLLYGNPLLRPMGDLDLLIQLQDRERCRDTLRRLGYRLETKGHALSFLDRFGVEVTAIRNVRALPIHLDLHEHLLNSEWLRRVVSIDLTSLWNEVQPFCLGDSIPVTRLGNEHLLIHQCLHWASHGFAGRKHGAEIAQLIQIISIRWTTLVRVAAAFRVRSIVYWALFWARAEESTVVPSWVWKELRPSRWRRRLLVKLVGSEKIPQDPEGGVKAEVFLLHLILVERARDLIKMLCFVVIPEPDWIRERYRLSSRWEMVVAYSCRWLRIFRYGVRALTRVLSH